MLTELLNDALFAAIAACGFGAVSDPAMRVFPRIALLAAAGHTVRFALMNYCGWDLAAVSFVAAVVAGIVLVARLKLRPSEKGKLLLDGYMGFISLWVAVVYYGVFCQDREYHVMFAIFWAMVALLWLLDFKADKIAIRRVKEHVVMGNIFMCLPLVYPVVSLLLGRGFPEMTSPLMPCSVAVFSAGVILSFPTAGSLVTTMCLCQWALIGLSKINYFRIPEDFILVCAILPALYLFFIEYVRTRGTDTKPSPRVLRWFIRVLCAVTGIFFLAVLAAQIGLG